MSDKHILVVGTGSVGKRHARNLASLGCRVSCVDPRQDRLDEIDEKLGPVGSFLSIEEALENGEDYDGVAITSPPSVHIAQSTLALEQGIPVLLEKPVSPDLESALKLEAVVKKAQVPLLLGYTYRWWPPLIEVKKRLESNVVGTLRHVKFVMSAHLADWHPWERYQDFFMASKELGGGALLDESHWIDLMLWFFGMPESVFAQIEKISDLEITTDDNVDIFVRYQNGLRVTLHLDLFGRPHEKYIQFVGENGTMRWTVDPNRIAIGKEWTDTWENTEYTCERNDMFMDVDREFLDVLSGETVKTCSINDGVDVLRIVEASRFSSRTGKMVNVVESLSD